MRIQSIIIGLILFIMTIAGALALEGGEIVGEWQVFDTPQARMSVYPHTASPINPGAVPAMYHQYFEVWNKGSEKTGVNVAFRFDDALDESTILEYVDEVGGTVIYDRTSDFSHAVIGGKHYYYLSTPTSWSDGETRMFDIKFSIVGDPENAKYDMAFWNGGLDCLVDDSCAWSFVLDPYTDKTLDPRIVESQESATDHNRWFGYGSPSDQYHWSQSFQLENTTNVTSISVYTGQGDGGPLTANANISIEAGSGGLPGGEVLLYNLTSGSIFTDGAGGSWRTVGFDGAETVLSAGTTYFLTIRTEQASSGYADWWDCDTNCYADGKGYFQQTRAGSWTQSGGGSVDLTFRIYGADINEGPYFVSLNAPADKSDAGDVTSALLNITVGDNDGDNLNVTFKAANGTEIGYQDDLNSTLNVSAAVTWSGLAYGEHQWYATVTDGYVEFNTSTYSFNTTETASETSIKAFYMTHPDVVFSGDDVTTLDANFSATAGDRFLIEVSLNARKAQPGIDSLLSSTMSIGGSIVGVEDEPLVTLVGDDNFYSTGKVSSIWEAPSTGSHNLILSFSSSFGTVNISDVDVLFRKDESMQNESIYLNSTRADGIISGVGVQDVVEFTIDKAISSESHYNLQQTYTSTAGSNTVTCYLTENGETSMRTPRYIDGAGDSASSLLTFVDGIQTSSHAHNVTCYQSVDTTTIYNASVLYHDLADASGNTITSAGSIYTSSNTTLAAGTYDVLNVTLTIVEGDAIYISSSTSLLDNSAGTWDMQIQTLVDGAVCSNKYRTVTDIGVEYANIFSYAICDGLSTGARVITQRITIPATEEARLDNYTSAIYGISVQELPVTLNDVAPVLVDACDDVSISHSKNLSCQYNVTDINVPALALDYAVNDTRVSINATGYLFDDANITETGCIDITTTVNNTAGSTTSAIEYCVTNGAPVFNSTIDDKSGTTPYAFNDSIYVYDPDGDTISASIDCTVSLNYTVPYVNLTYQTSTAETQTCIVTLNDSIETATSSFTVTVVQSTATDNILETGMCPETLAGTFNMWMFLIFVIFLISLSIIVLIPILAMLGAFGLAFVGFTMVGCSVGLGSIVIFCAIMVLVYSITMWFDIT